MSKITLKNNKMMGGMNVTAKVNQGPSKRVQKKPVASLSASTEMIEDPLTIIKSLKTYKERQIYNLINISYSNITALLNILIVYLDNIGVIAEANNPKDQPFKIQLKETLTTLLNNINEFKINHTQINNKSLVNEINEILAGVEYDTTKKTFSFYNDKIFSGMFNPTMIEERYFEEYIYKNILVEISNIINETNIIFNKLLSNNIREIIPTINDSENKTILEHNIILLIYIQLISYKFFKEISKDNKLLGITSQNTYKTSKKIHEQLYKILQESLK